MDRIGTSPYCGTVPQDHVDAMLASFRKGRGYEFPVDAANIAMEPGRLAIIPGTCIDCTENPHSFVVAWSGGAAVVLTKEDKPNKFTFIKGGFPVAVAAYAAQAVKGMIDTVAKDREPKGHKPEKMETIDYGKT